MALKSERIVNPVMDPVMWAFIQIKRALSTVRIHTSIYPYNHPSPSAFAFHGILPQFCEVNKSFHWIEKQRIVRVSH